MEKTPRNVIFVMPRPMIETAKRISLLTEVLEKYDCFAYFTEHVFCLEQCTDQIIIMYISQNWKPETIRFLQKQWENENLYLIFADHKTKSSVSPILIFRPEIDNNEQTVTEMTSPFYCILNALHSALQQKNYSCRIPVAIFQPFEITVTGKFFLEVLHEKAPDALSCIVCDPTDVIPNSQTRGISVLQKDTEITDHSRLHTLIDFTSRQTKIGKMKVFHHSPKMESLAATIRNFIA